MSLRARAQPPAPGGDKRSLRAVLLAGFAGGARQAACGVTAEEELLEDLKGKKELIKGLERTLKRCEDRMEEFASFQAERGMSLDLESKEPNRLILSAEREEIEELEEEIEKLQEEHNEAIESLQELLREEAPERVINAAAAKVKGFYDNIQKLKEELQKLLGYL